MIERPATNRKGQRLGAKGDRMRLAMMAATLNLLATEKLWTIKVADIAAACGVRAPLFYAYFNSVEDVIVALIEQANDDQPDIARLIDQAWTPENAHRLAREIVILSTEHWDKYRPALKILHMLADDGEDAFMRLRIARLRPMSRAFDKLLQRAKAAERLSPRLAPRLAAYGLAMRIEQSGATWHLTKLSGAPIEELIDTLATFHVALVRGMRLYPALEESHVL